MQQRCATRDFDTLLSIAALPARLPADQLCIPGNRPPLPSAIDKPIRFSDNIQMHL